MMSFKKAIICACASAEVFAVKMQDHLPFQPRNKEVMGEELQLLKPGYRLISEANFKRRMAQSDISSLTHPILKIAEKYEREQAELAQKKQQEEASQEQAVTDLIFAAHNALSDSANMQKTMHDLLCVALDGKQFVLTKDQRRRLRNAADYLLNAMPLRNKPSSKKSSSSSKESLHKKSKKIKKIRFIKTDSQNSQKGPFLEGDELSQCESSNNEPILGRFLDDYKLKMQCKDEQAIPTTNDKGQSDYEIIAFEPVEVEEEDEVKSLPSFCPTVIENENETQSEFSD